MFDSTGGESLAQKVVQYDGGESGGVASQINEGGLFAEDCVYRDALRAAEIC